jgi:hypothetical protein
MIFGKKEGPRIEKTESTVVQVAPSYENAKIKEMENFGWNLQNRQEIHEEGDAYGGPSVFSDEYIIKTKVYHYVKLHFARSLDLPNLDKIRELEDEYFGLPEPDFPRLLPGGFLLLLFWYPFWPLYYFLSYRKKKVTAMAQLKELIQKRREILPKVAEYTKKAGYL